MRGALHRARSDSVLRATPEDANVIRMDITTSKRVRVGLYRVTTATGEVFAIENRRAAPEWGGQWMWYTTAEDQDLWFDPTWTKAEALDKVRAL